MVTTLPPSPQPVRAGLRSYLKWSFCGLLLLVGLAGSAYVFRKAVLRALTWPIATSFHILYYHSSERTWHQTYWLGQEVEKNPFDLWVLQEIIYETRPDLIIEAGTWKGGSAFYMASICDQINHGQVVTIDIEEQPRRPQHPRIRYLLGSSTSQQITDQIKSLIKPNDRVMVDLDSDHHKEHVLRELRIYSKLVTKGMYLVVEDTNTNGHPVGLPFSPGPMEALEEFFKENSDFVSDRSREKFFVTFNPKGYLRKIR